jgi:hypothetical protein
MYIIDDLESHILVNNPKDKSEFVLVVNVFLDAGWPYVELSSYSATGKYAYLNYVDRFLVYTTEIDLPLITTEIIIAGFIL